MIVLDYLRSTSDGTIIVPPFQSGHLGFMPGREVQVYLVRPHMEQTHCEVVITPYQQNEQNLVRLTCVMDDQRGVVQRLIRSISTLGINIIAQESSSVHYQAYHYVSMLLDFSTSSIRDKRDPIPGAESRYAAFLPEAPLLQGRYVDLFESVIAHCGDVIKWTGASGVQSARFNIQPVESETDVRFHHPVTIGSPSLKGHKYNVSIQLEASLVAEIKLYLDTNSENLNYLLVSETDDRKLRAFFPKPEVVPRLIHLGFYHTDTPGTLAALLEPIKDARFNILTSLQRKHSQTINIWEAILEYQGEDDVPVGGEAQCRWVAEKLVSVLVGSEVTENIRRRNISVAPPRYPKGANTWKGRVEINDLLGPYNQTQKSQRRSESVGASRERLLDAISDRIFEMREAYVDEFDPRWRIVQSVKERVEKVRPTVFLSYPSSARNLAEILKRQLVPQFEIDEYQTPNGDVVLHTVMDKVRNCDLFVGIWHHEGVNQSKELTISPWLPFEYGVAQAERKPWMLVRSSQIPVEIWNRLNPEYSMYCYEDTLHFADSIVPAIVSFCKHGGRPKSSKTTPF